MTERCRNDGVGGLRNNEYRFAGMMNKVVRTKQDTRTLETKIHQMLYKLYDLTDDEIGIIENNATPDLVIPAKAGIQ